MVFYSFFMCICLFPVLYKEEELSCGCVLAVHLYLLCQQKNHMLIEAAENAAIIKGLPMLSLTSLDYFYLLKMDK